MTDDKPDELKTERVQLLMTPTEVAAIDEWGYQHRIRTRAEAIRRLAQLGMLGWDAYTLLIQSAKFDVSQLRGEPVSPEALSKWRDETLAMTVRAKEVVGRESEVAKLASLYRDFVREFGGAKDQEESGYQLVDDAKVSDDITKAIQTFRATQPDKPSWNETIDRMTRLLVEQHTAPDKD